MRPGCGRLSAACWLKKLTMSTRSALRDAASNNSCSGNGQETQGPELGAVRHGAARFALQLGDEDPASNARSSNLGAHCQGPAADESGERSHPFVELHIGVAAGHSSKRVPTVFGTNVSLKRAPIAC